MASKMVLLEIMPKINFRYTPFQDQKIMWTICENENCQCEFKNRCEIGLTESTVFYRIYGKIVKIEPYTDDRLFEFTSRGSFWRYFFNCNLSIIPPLYNINFHNIAKWYIRSIEDEIILKIELTNRKDIIINRQQDLIKLIANLTKNEHIK